MTRDQIKSLLLSNPRAVERAILALYHCQTVGEQHTSSTREQNGRGFNCFDAEYGSYLGRWLLSGRHLTGSHLQRARQMALRYVGQLARMSETPAVPARVVATVEDRGVVTDVVLKVRSMCDAIRLMDLFQSSHSF